MVILYGIVGIVLLLALHIRYVQKRSLASWCFEQKLRIRARNNGFDAQNPKRFAQTLQLQQAISDQSFVPPAISFPIEEFYVESMQTLVWNDRQDPAQKVIYYIHGGAYVSQPSPYRFSMLDKLTKQLDAKVVFPIYPKLPRYCYEDALRACRALYEQLLSRTNSPQNITLMGDSSGGGLALALAMHLRDEGIVQPKDIVLISPWLDVHCNHPDIPAYEKVDPISSPAALAMLGKIWAGSEEAMRSPFVSPIFGNFTDLARISLFVGNYDIFMPDCEKLHGLLVAQGIAHYYHVADKMPHIYIVYPIPEARRALAQIREIIQNE